MAQSPDLRIELKEVLVGAESLVIYYYNVTRGKKAAEVVVFNPEGESSNLWLTIIETC